MNELKKSITPITILLCILCIVMAINSPVDYKHQPDARKREYYPAIVIDKYVTNYCSKRNCNNSHYIRIEMKDGHHKEVLVTEGLYNDTSIGRAVELERHITDPLIRSQEGARSMWIVGLLFLVIVRGGLIMYNIIKTDETTQ